MSGVDLERARVVPVTDDAVVLHARTVDGRTIEGQVAVDETSGIEEVWVAPNCTAASVIALEAIAAADLVVLGPGSLYSSVLAAVVVGDLRKALLDTSARLVLVGNLESEPVEREGCEVSDHLAVLGRHGVHPDLVLVHDDGLPLGRPAIDVVTADLVGSGGIDHDPVALGGALRRIAERGA